jgi:hypothetical protein
MSKAAFGQEQSFVKDACLGDVGSLASVKGGLSTYSELGTKPLCPAAKRPSDSGKHPVKRLLTRASKLLFSELLPLNSADYWTIRTIRENIRYKVLCGRIATACHP